MHSSIGFRVKKCEVSAISTVTELETLNYSFQASKRSEARSYSSPNHSASATIPPSISQPKLSTEEDDYSMADLRKRMEALHLSRIRSSTNSSIKSSRSRALKINTQRSVVPQIKDVLTSMRSTSGSNYKSASVEEADSLESGDKTFLSESTVADRNREEELKSRSHLDLTGGREVRSTTRISRGVDGETRVTGVMSFPGSPLLSPENATLLKRIPPGIYERICMKKDGITITENAVDTFVPRCLEETFTNTVPLRRSTPYSVSFSNSTSSEKKLRNVNCAGTNREAANTKNRPAHTENHELPPRAKLEQAVRDQTISDRTLPDKAFFMDCRFLGCWGQSLVLRDCNFKNCRFSYSNIADCRFSNCTIEESILIDCRFSESEVVGGKVIDCDPKNSRIR